MMKVWKKGSRMMSIILSCSMTCMLMSGSAFAVEIPEKIDAGQRIAVSTPSSADREQEDNAVKASDSNAELKNPACERLEESDRLLDRLLEINNRMQELIEAGQMASEEFRSLDEESAELYIHIDSCEICQRQMAEDGAYYEKFYGVQVLDETAVRRTPLNLDDPEGCGAVKNGDVYVNVSEGWSWNPSTMELTLTDFKLECNTPITTNRPEVTYQTAILFPTTVPGGSPAAVVILNGDNYIKNTTPKMAQGIRCTGSLIIKGSGSLDIQCTDAANVAGIMMNSSSSVLTIGSEDSEPDVTIQTDGAQYSYGIRSYTTVIKAGTVTINSTGNEGAEAIKAENDVGSHYGTITFGHMVAKAYNDSENSYTLPARIKDSLDGLRLVDDSEKDVVLNHIQINSGTVQDIELLSEPKLSYLAGEKFNPSNTTVKITYEDGITDTVTYKYSSSNPFDIKKIELTAEGTPLDTNTKMNADFDGKKLIVTCEEKTAEAKTPFSIDTGVQSITILHDIHPSIYPYPSMEFLEGETLDLSVLGVIIKDANGTTANYLGTLWGAGKAVLTSLDENNFDTIAQGSVLTLADDGKKITVGYGGKTATTKKAISVYKRELTSITISGQPDKLDYIEGEKLDLSGLKATLDFNDSFRVAEYTMEEFETNGIIVNYQDGTELTLADQDKTITVSYGDKSVETMPLNIAEKKISAVVMETAPEKTAYIEGDLFNPYGLVLTVTYNNGKTEEIAYSDDNKLDFAFTPALDTALTTGDNTVTVTYQGETSKQTIAITVKPVTITAVTMKAAPEKTAYTEGELFDPTGLVLTVTYNNGKTEEIAYSDDNKSDFTFSPALDTKLTVGDTAVSITYQGQILEQPINVTHKKSSSNNTSSNSTSVISAPKGWSQTDAQNPVSWRYYDASGNYIRSSWQQLEYNGVTKWYHLNENGYINVGWFLDIDGSWYYLNPISNGSMGAMQTGWLTDPLDGYRYYLDPQTGKMVTGWRLIDGVWCYFNEVGAVDSGWMVDANTGRWIYEERNNKPLGVYEEDKQR